MTRLLAVLILVASTAGCRDSADAMSRDYRSMNNEVIDALMMVTSDDMAKNMLDRVLTDYPDRIEKIEHRVKVWKQNNEKDDYASQLYGSDSTMILVIENKINQKRLAMESSRLNQLAQQLVAIERQEGARGNARAEEVCPNLVKILTVNDKSAIKKLAEQMTTNNELLRVLDEVRKDEKLNKKQEIINMRDGFFKKLGDFDRKALDVVR